MSKSSKPAVSYTVTIIELSYSGAMGAPLEWSRSTGKRARERAIETAEREFPTRASIVSVFVHPRGGANDGAIVWSKVNPAPYMHAGEVYCAGIYVREDGAIMAIHGVSRDSRKRYAAPPSYTEEELKGAWQVRDYNDGRRLTFEQAVARVEHTRRSTG